MTRKFNRKALAIGAVFALLAAGGAYAYWTQTGSGTGTAATGSGSAIVVNQTTTVSALSPASTPQALSGNFNNPNPGTVRVATVTASLASISGGAGGTPACTTADYRINNPTATVNATIASGNGVGSWSGPTIEMLDAATNQDACKGATVNISYSSN
ncbi:MAG: hypothetical protein QOE11_2545 [Solirubrobacteraceae bacterium]|jgi:hypothetical protein|nr:hypothetical protein [Solirubrobacteraceae bacterium]